MIVGKYKEPDNIGEPDQESGNELISVGNRMMTILMQWSKDRMAICTSRDILPVRIFLLSEEMHLQAEEPVSIKSGQATDNIFIMKITRDGKSIKSSVIGGDGDDGSFDLRILKPAIL